MSITAYQVVGGDKTLQQIERSLKRGKFTRSVERPDGESVVLETSAGGFKTVGDGNLYATISDEHLDEYKAPGGSLLSVVKVRTIDIAFTSNARHLLVFAGRQGAGPVASKVSEIVFNAKDDPVLACSISPDKIDAFISEHKAEILYCSWSELRIPALNGASLRGSEIGTNLDFKRFDMHGLKNSVRAKLPALGMTLSINREASMHFYTSHELDEQIAFVRKHILPMCR